MMNLYDHLSRLLTEANKLSMEEVGDLFMARAELKEWVALKGKIGPIAMGLEAMMAATKEQEKRELAEKEL